MADEARWERPEVLRLIGAGLGLAVGLTVVLSTITSAHADGLHLFPVAASKHLVDLQVYRMGGLDLLHRRDPYRSLLPGSGLPYTYTPFSTVMLAPIAVVPWRVARTLHTMVSILALFTSVVLVGRELGGPGFPPRRLIGLSSLATLAFFWSEPVLQTLGYGQIDLVLMAMVLIDLLALRRTRWAGVLIGVATGIKLTPMVFVAYLLVLRRYRPAVTALCTAAATVVLGWILLPGPSHRYFTDLLWDPNRVGRPAWVGNQSLSGLWTRAAGSYEAGHPYWLVSAAAVFVVGLWAAGRTNRRVGEPYGLAVCALTGVLISPISWSHHWVWWVVPALCLAAAAYRRRSWALWVLLVAVSIPFYVGPFWHIDRHNWETKPVGWQQPISDTYVLIGLAALLALTTWLIRSHRGAAALSPPRSARSPGR